MRRLSFQHRLRLKFDVADTRMETENALDLVFDMPIRTTSCDTIFVGALEGLSINSDQYGQPFNIEARIKVHAWYSLAEPLLPSSSRMSENNKEPAPKVDLDFMVNIHDTNHLEFCLELLGTACLENITSLRLVAKDRCASALAQHVSSTVELFIRLPRLRSCVLVGGYVGAFVKALAKSVRRGPRKPHDGLEELVLADFVCGNSDDQIDKLTGSLLAYAQSRNGGLKRVRLVDYRGIGRDVLDDVFQKLRDAGVVDVSV